jgi:hypothetical protein
MTQTKNESRWFNNAERRRHMKYTGELKYRAFLRKYNRKEYFKLISESNKKGKELHNEYNELISKKLYAHLSKLEEDIVKRLKEDGKSKKEIDSYIDEWQNSMTFDRKAYIKSLDQHRTNKKSRSYQNRIRKNG